MNFLNIDDLTREELDDVLTRATDLKERTARGKTDDAMDGRTLGMIFEKPSTRTRVSLRDRRDPTRRPRDLPRPRRHPSGPRRTGQGYGACRSRGTST